MRCTIEARQATVETNEQRFRIELSGDGPLVVGTDLAAFATAAGGAEGPVRILDPRAPWVEAARVVAAGETVFRRVPMVGKIYGTMREIADTFGGRRRGLFSRVVLLEWPREGMYAIGFVTQEGQGEVQEKTPEHIVNVFVPTTPNPTSGLFLMMPRSEVISLNMSVDAALKYIVSMGVVAPPVAAIAPSAAPTPEVAQQVSASRTE